MTTDEPGPCVMCGLRREEATLRQVDYATPMRPTTDLADLRAAKHAAMEACWRMETALAEAVRATNRLRRLMGLPEVDPYKPWPGAAAMDAAVAKLGWAP